MTLTMMLNKASVVKISFGKLHAFISASILLVLMSEIAKVCGTKRGKFNNHNLQIYVTIQNFVLQNAINILIMHIILFLMVEFLSIHVTFITLLDSLMLCLLRMKRLSRRERTNPLIDV